MKAVSDSPRTRLSRRQLDALIEKATVDAYGDDEQLTGFFTMIEDNLALPFESNVIGVTVVVRKVELVDEEILALCQAGRNRQRLPILELPLPEPPPVGHHWIAAYREWRRRGWR